MTPSADAAIDSRGRAFHVAAALFLMMTAFLLAKTGRDAMFFQRGGLLDLPKAYLGIAVLSVPAAFAVLALMKWLGPRPARVAAPLAMSGALLVYAATSRPGGGGSMTIAYMMLPLAFGVLFSQAWLLAADLLESAPRVEIAKAYSRIGAASIGGGIFGSAVAAVLAPHVEPRALVALGAAFLAGSALTSARAQRRYPLEAAIGIAKMSARAPGIADFRRVVEERYSFLLLAVAMTASLVGLLVEFQFYIAATLADHGGRANARFFATFSLALNVVALAAQLYVMPRVQKRIGVHGSLLVLPTALLGFAGALLFNATILSRSLLRAAEGGLKSSIHRVNWEQAYLPLGRARRAAAKLFVDGFGARLAEGLGAGILFVWIRVAMPGGAIDESRIRWMTWMLLAAALVWISLTRALRSSLASASGSVESEAENSFAIPLPDS